MLEIKVLLPLGQLHVDQGLLLRVAQSFLDLRSNRLFDRGWLMGRVLTIGAIAKVAGVRLDS